MRVCAFARARFAAFDGRGWSLLEVASMSEAVSAAAVLGWIARGQAVASRGYPGDAANWLAANGAPERAQRIVKAAIGAGTTTDSDLGSYGISIGQWSEACRTRSVFYRLLADGAFVAMPMYTPIGIAVGTLSGALVDEGAGTPVGKVKIGNVQLLPHKAVALIVVTQELLRDVSSAGQTLFNRELLGAISDAVDSAVFEMLIDTSSPSIASTSPLADLRAALLAVNSVGLARLYWVAAPDVAKLASTLSITDGGPAFAAASATGGELANLPLLVSSGLGAGTLALLNGSGIAANGLAPVVSVSTQADIAMDTAPPMNATTPTPAQMVSMFQTNSAAVKAIAEFAVEKLRDDAVTTVTGINATTWGSA
jgi:hypothetical protein